MGLGGREDRPCPIHRPRLGLVGAGAGKHVLGGMRKGAGPSLGGEPQETCRPVLASPRACCVTRRVSPASILKYSSITHYTQKVLFYAFEMLSLSKTKVPPCMEVNILDGKENISDKHSKMLINMLENDKCYWGEKKKSKAGEVEAEF